MVQIIALAFPMALLWMIFGRQFTWEGFIVGYLFGLGIVTLVKSNVNFTKSVDEVERQREQNRFSSNRILILPLQVIWTLVYAVRLSISIFLGGVDVASRVILPRGWSDIYNAIEPGEYRVVTQDDSHDPLISGLSAHSITITPGELVIDFEHEEGEQTVMIVHVLDKSQSTPQSLKADQTNRLSVIKRILGRD